MVEYAPCQLAMSALTNVLETVLVLASPITQEELVSKASMGYDPIDRKLLITFAAVLC